MEPRRTSRRLSVVRRLATCVVIAVASLLAACGTASGPSDEETTGGGPAPSASSPAQGLPPSSRVEPGDQPPEPQVLTRTGWMPVDVTSTCWEHEDTAFCADGIAAPPYVTAVPGADATFAFPIEGWTFTALAQPLVSPDAQLDPCTRFVDMTVTTSGSAFQAAVDGPAGRYLVHLNGQGPQGSVSSSFAWTFTVSRQTPPATGHLALLTDHDGELDSYGVEVGIRGLDSGYPDATATATVTAVDGSSRTYGPYRDRDRNRCDDGSIFITSPRSEPEPSPDLGPGPYQYRVELFLAGRTYIGTAVWPRDERPDEAPNTDLVFAPPLPRYAGS